MTNAIDQPALEAIANLAPRRLNTFIQSGWVESISIARPVNAKGEPIPWFTYPAIEFLEQRINPAWHILEWGCGNSTLWWAARVARVTSIEHNPQWHQEISGNAPGNATITLIEDPKRYANLTDAHRLAPPNVIVIDGEHRAECAKTAHAIACDTTLIVLDNSDRPSLKPAMNFLRSSGWNRLDLYGLIPCFAYRTCTSVFYREAFPEANDVLPCDFVSCLGPTLSQTLKE